MTNGVRYEFTIGNHTEQAHDYTSDLIDKAYRRKGADNPTTHLERVREADRLCEAHYAIIGDFPAGSVLSRLAWYIVFDEMTDSHPDKMTREEYPIMSESQEELRDSKQIKTRSGEITYEGRQANGRRKSYYFGDDGEVGVSNSKMPDIYDRDIEGTVENIDVLDLLDSAGLTERQREAIELVYFDGLTQAQAGERMGVSQPMIKKYIDVSLTKIKEKFTKKGYKIDD